MTDLYKVAQSLVTEARDKLSPQTFIENAISEMDRGDVERLAVAYLLSQVKQRQRANVLSIERAATSKSKMPRYGTAAFDRWALEPENEERATAERKLRDHYAEIDRKAQVELWATMKSAMDKFAEELKVEWTQELLASEFALGDGTKVRWGNATREQHEYRIAMHKRNAIAGMEGVARHQQAIDTLDSTGCITLAEAVRVAA